PPKRIA
nr:Chain D, Rcc1 [Homo sapiens]5E1M_E Chain E, Rcc1 [Homo sapiens]